MRTTSPPFVRLGAQMMTPVPLAVGPADALAVLERAGQPASARTQERCDPNASTPAVMATFCHPWLPSCGLLKDRQWRPAR